MATDRGVCERFRLDYYTDEQHRSEPAHRYCVCGWTEAHHGTVDQLEVGSDVVR